MVSPVFVVVTKKGLIKTKQQLTIQVSDKIANPIYIHIFSSSFLSFLFFFFKILETIPFQSSGGGRNMIRNKLEDRRRKKKSIECCAPLSSSCQGLPLFLDCAAQAIWIYFLQFKYYIYLLLIHYLSVHNLVPPTLLISLAHDNWPARPEMCSDWLLQIQNMCPFTQSLK